MNSKICFALITTMFAGNLFSQGLISTSSPQPADGKQITVPLGGNAYKTTKDRSGGNVSNSGITNWTDGKADFDSYVWLAQAGTVQVWVLAKVPEGKSRISIRMRDVSKEIDIEGAAEKEYYAGEWKIKDTGYLAINIKGISKSGERFADVSNLKFGGSAINDKTAYVKDNEGNFFHWGRRGPSVHLGYTSPENTDVEWFYNEITVPEGDDVVGSYFMANGFGEGYFGIQVNSPTERRILFSVWSPFSTNDPKSIPDDQKIQLLKKGDEVHGGEFGNEGSGGQSYLKYNWKAATTYKFLLHGVPDGANNTTYTAYFYAPEKGKWMLIASFKRPKTNTWLKRLHSFLENFSPEQGNLERKVLFSNQWVRDSKGQWTELNKGRFTGDNTAGKGYRVDYAGGLMNNSFYLRNGGFFNDRTKLNSYFERPLAGKKPVINFEAIRSL